MGILRAHFPQSPNQNADRGYQKVLLIRRIYHIGPIRKVRYPNPTTWLQSTQQTIAFLFHLNLHVTTITALASSTVRETNLSGCLTFWCIDCTQAKGHSQDFDCITVNNVCLTGYLCCLGTGCHKSKEA